MLIRKSAPQPRFKNTGTGGRKRARKYSSTSDYIKLSAIFHLLDNVVQVILKRNSATMQAAVGKMLTPDDAGLAISIIFLYLKGSLRSRFDRVG